MNCSPTQKPSSLLPHAGKGKKGKTHLTRGADRVRAHLVPPKPVADSEPHGELRVRLDAVDRVLHTPDKTVSRGPSGGRRREARREGTHASGAPEGASLPWGVGCDGVVGRVEDIGDGENVGLDDLVVEHDRVERSVDAVVDVVCGGVEKKKERTKAGQRPVQSEGRRKGQG